MAENTGISWTDSTWNPWIGCTKVGPGCDNCYAEALMDKRWHRVQWGSGKQRVRTSASNWMAPLHWEKHHEAFARIHGRRRRVFCASLADVFDNEVPPEWRDDLWALVKATPHLAWLVLTKRIGNVAGMAPAEGLPPNVWLGATIVTQEEADRDIPKLLHIPATVRFLSMEPLLEPVDLSSLLHLTVARNGAWQCNNKFHERRPEWIIVGGESGSKARPFNLHWARDIVAQCKAAGVRVHVKQLGAVVHADRGDSFLLRLRDKAGGDMAEWPEDLRVRQHPDHSF